MPTSQQFILGARPQGELSDSDLVRREIDLTELAEGEVRVRLACWSIDPTIRLWMSDVPQYMPPIELGEVVRSIGGGVVEASRHPGFAEGDPVTGILGWQTRAQGAPEAMALTKVPPGLDFDQAIALMGLTSGMTAYFGLLDVTNPKPGEVLVVDAAAGSVGSLVGQIGKIKGCKVIGIAGGSEKCGYVRDELGFDACIDYRNENVGEALDRLCPEGIDICFENVGGPIFDEILLRMKLFGRVSVCGLIAGYNLLGQQVPGPMAFGMILMRRLTVRGFIVTDYGPRFAEAAADLGTWAAAGKLKTRLYKLQGFANLPNALRELVGGSAGNIGKMIVDA